MLEFFELLFELLDVVALLLLMKDVILIVSEDLQQKRKDLVLLFFYGPVSIDERASKQVQDGVQSHLYL